MNAPPEVSIRVREDRLLAFVATCFERAGCQASHAALIARLLVNNDLRGVRSHASRTAHGYCSGLADGALNPRPDVRVVLDTPAVTVLDGDGTLGYLPMVRASEAAVAKARQVGVGAGLVRHIGHYGSAGHYSRICADAGCVGWSVQGYRHEAEPKDPPRSAADSGNPPYSFALPAGQEPAIVVDAGCAFDSPFPSASFDEIARRFPSPFFKSMGLIATSTLVGGALTGFLGPRGDEVERRWPGARMGGTVVAFDLQRLGCEAEFRAEADRYVRGIREGHTPIPGTDRAQLPGAIEEEKTRSYRREGIPYGEPEQAAARALSERFGVPLPWAGSEG